MKKWILSIAAAVMLLCMCAQVFARENAMSVTDAAAEPGQTVFLTVRLNESAVGDTLAISYDFDSKLLTAIPESCKWERSSQLADFDKNKNIGAWAAPSIMDLKGDICTLAFRINTGVSFKSTKVTCTMQVMHGNQVAGTYTAAAIVSVSCKHGSYGDWLSRDPLVHGRSCSQCGNVQSGTHKWDSGVLSENPSDSLSKLLTLTCNLCKGTKTIVVTDSLSEPDGTKPQENTKPTNPGSGNTGATKPQEPECTDPEHDHPHPDDVQRPTGPSGNGSSQNRPDEERPTGSNGQTGNQPDHDDHDHGQLTTKPNQNTQDDDHAGHDHSHDDEKDTSDPTNWIVGAVVFLIAAGLVAGGVIFVMKKK